MTVQKAFVALQSWADIGNICHEYDPYNQMADVAVEMVDEAGLSIWLDYLSLILYV